jgi:hypothetical protein
MASHTQVRCGVSALRVAPIRRYGELQGPKKIKKLLLKILRRKIIKDTNNKVMVKPYDIHFLFVHIS